MAKQLPKLFQNKINKDLKNNNKIYYSANKDQNNIDDLKDNKIDINQKLNNIFTSSNYIYKANVTIKTKDNSYDTKIIGKNRNFIITIDNKTIPISDIIDIEIKK